MPNTKQKSFRISEELAIEFEVHARKTQTKEVDLIHRPMPCLPAPDAG